MKNNIKNIILILTINLLATGNYGADTIIKMENVNGVYYLPCSVNGIYMWFVYDTGASDVTLSLTEAQFMLKNGYLSVDDIVGTENYQIANGDIEEGTIINIREIIIGDLILRDVKGSIIHEMKAPLLLGQSVLERLGNIEFNYENNTLTIKEDSTKSKNGKKSTYDLTSETKSYNKDNQQEAFELRNHIKSFMDKVRFYKKEPKQRVKIPY